MPDSLEPSVANRRSLWPSAAACARACNRTGIVDWTPNVGAGGYSRIGQKHQCEAPLRRGASQGSLKKHNLRAAKSTCGSVSRQRPPGGLVAPASTRTGRCCPGFGGSRPGAPGDSFRLMDEVAPLRYLLRYGGGPVLFGGCTSGQGNPSLGGFCPESATKQEALRGLATRQCAASRKPSCRSLLTRSTKLSALVRHLPSGSTTRLPSSLRTPTLSGQSPSPPSLIVQEQVPENVHQRKPGSSRANEISKAIVSSRSRAPPRARSVWHCSANLFLRMPMQPVVRPA